MAVAALQETPELARSIRSSQGSDVRYVSERGRDSSDQRRGCRCAAPRSAPMGGAAHSSGIFRTDDVRSHTEHITGGDVLSALLGVQGAVRPVEIADLRAVRVPPLGNARIRPRRNGSSTKQAERHTVRSARHARAARRRAATGGKRYRCICNPDCKSQSRHGDGAFGCPTPRAPLPDGR